MLTKLYTLTLGHRHDSPRDEYSANRKYYQINLNLTQVPTDIPADALKVVIVFNRITNVKTNVFSQLTQCTVLDVQRNLISEVEPGAFNGLRAVTYLNLRNNRLERLYPNMFAGLNNCIQIALSNNSIGQIEAGSWNVLGQVTWLDLTCNQLISLSADMFQGLLTLKRLSLSDNIINSIEDNTFANLKELEQFGLSINRFTMLPPNIFSGTNSLVSVGLGGNPLTALPEDIFKYLPRPFDLGLDRSPGLKCDVEMSWLKYAMLHGDIRCECRCENKMVSIYNMTCGKPGNDVSPILNSKLD